MVYRVLVTTTSFFDTPGAHHDRLTATGYDIVKARGPLTEQTLLDLLGDGAQFDGVICGEDQFTHRVLEAMRPRGKALSKYGVGLDRIDLEAAKHLGIKVCNTPGVNHTTVAEHALGLLLSLVRKIPEENEFVHRGEWRRITGSELAGKTIGIFGFGRVGKEVAKRAMAFGMKVIINNTSWSSQHAYSLDELKFVFSHPVFSEYPPTIEHVESEEEALRRSDVVSLHMNLNSSSANFMNRRRLGICKRGVYVINVSRGKLVDQVALSAALRSGHVAGYGADVMDPEPISNENPLLGIPNVHLTPHIGSRTRESVERQGVAAVVNIQSVLEAAPNGTQAARNS